MPELCLSGSSNSPNFSNLILSHFKFFFSFIHSHPIYFCYIIFFSPYILKLFSFLSPLLITTSLLLLGYLTICPQSKALKEKLSSNIDTNDDFCRFEELEVYKIVFDTSSFYQIENLDEDHENTSCEISSMVVFEGLDLMDEKTVEVDWEESVKPPSLLGLGESDYCSDKPMVEEKNLEEFLEPLEDFEDVPFYEDEKAIKLPNMDLDKFNLKKEVSQASPKSDESEEIESKKSIFSDSPSSSTLDSSLSSYGSMRREKEWTRTLACKLFEERHRRDGEEGMDLLWETYENDSSNKGKKTKSNPKKNNNMTKIDTEFRYEDDDDGDEVATQQLCCLQALKFSTRKMNLGMGRPNIAKVSKAIKGFGWLHKVTKHSKRGNTSNRLIN